MDNKSTKECEYVKQPEELKTVKEYQDVYDEIDEKYKRKEVEFRLQINPVEIIIGFGFLMEAITVIDAFLDVLKEEKCYYSEIGTEYKKVSKDVGRVLTKYFGIDFYIRRDGYSFVGYIFPTQTSITYLRITSAYHIVQDKVIPLMKQRKIYPNHDPSLVYVARIDSKDPLIIPL